MLGIESDCGRGWNDPGAILAGDVNRSVGRTVIDDEGLVAWTQGFEAAAQA